MLNIVKMVQVLKYKFSEEDGKQKLAVMLSILEPAIVNDENVTIAVHLDLVEIIQDFMLLTLEEFENRALKKADTPKATKSTKGAKGAKAAEPEPPVIDTGNSAPLYLKLLIRCLTSCLRLEVGVQRYVKVPKNISDLSKLMSILKDEESIANGCKCIRISLRDERNLQAISVHSDGELVNELIDLIGKHKESEYVLQEASSVSYSESSTL